MSSSPEATRSEFQDCHGKDPEARDDPEAKQDPEKGSEPQEGLETEQRALIAERDSTLVASTLAGDLEAFETLIGHYQRAIFNVAYYKSRNVFDAEDLAQDVFLAAYKALATLKEPGNFGGWLFGIAHNRCHKWFRREKTKVLKFKEIREQREQEARIDRREAEESDDSRVRVSREITQLPHEIREVLVLKYLEGKSYEVIESRLGLTAYRIDYLIRKGKALLKKRLQRKDML
jgi:RNA polymerase sigma-70 factor (ECF subfamily)